MAVEILGGNGLYKAFRELGIKATRTYKGKEKPHYEVWELSKDDLKKLEYAVEWKDEWGWFCHSNGEHRGTAFEFLTIRNQFVIGWAAQNNNNTFECLTDYFINGLDVIDMNIMCAYSMYIAKTNGWSLSKTWSMLEG
jgi:hypothetical protein